jgi:hypothetical protein
MTRLWNDPHMRYAYSQTIGKLDILLVFGGKESKGPKEGKQHRHRSPMPEGGNFCFNQLHYLGT